MKTTEEKNIEIGNFLGVKFYEETGHYYDADGAFIGTKLVFDNDYELLMESVEKIEDIEDGRFDVNILKYGTQIIDFSNEKKIIIDNVANISFEKKIDHIFDSVVKFIEWYNQQNLEIMKTFFVTSVYADMVLDTYKIKAVDVSEAIKKAKNKLTKLTDKSFAEKCEYLTK